MSVTPNAPQPAEADNPAAHGSLTGVYKFDLAHSSLAFIARHAMVTKVRGAFTAFDGTIHLDEQYPAQSSAVLTIDVASIDTRNGQRDEHLRTNDFLDAETYPEIRFRSTGIEQRGDHQFQVIGDLTIKDVTRSVSVDLEFTGAVTDPTGARRIGFEGNTTINRKDYGVNFHAVLEAGGVMVSDKIALEFDISAVKAM